ncbi:MAG TPA: hypothetical protein DDZ89_02715, partial [Clostridiales bacterium]|nr:hypothetical protein [Clostridiales bacterium]
TEQGKGTLAGEDIEFGSSPGYGWLKDVSRTNAAGSFEALFETGDAQNSGLRIIYPKSQSGELIKAKGEARGLFLHSEMNPYLIKRNRFGPGEENSSVFISLLEPYQGRGEIISIEDVPSLTTCKDPTSYAVLIRMEDCTHFYCGSLSQEKKTYCFKGHKVEVCAEHLFLEESSGVLTKGTVVSGKFLTIDGKNKKLHSDVLATVKKVDLQTGQFDLIIEFGYLSFEDFGAIVLTEIGTIQRNGIQIERVEPIEEGIVRICPKYRSLSVGTIVVKQVQGPCSILTVSEFGKTYSLPDFYDHRPVHTKTGEINVIKSRTRVDASLYQIEFEKPFEKPLVTGDRLQIPAIHEGARVVIHKTTCLDFDQP